MSKINSLQNGMLIQRDIHSAFDQYLISVNPDVCVSLKTIVLRLVAYYDVLEGNAPSLPDAL